MEVEEVQSRGQLAAEAWKVHGRWLVEAEAAPRRGWTTHPTVAL